MKIEQIPIKEIKPSPYQRREAINETGIGELAKSIKAQGMINPLTIRKNGNGYEVVCGHRRLLALRLLKEKTASCIIRDLTDAEAKKILVAENLAREDLTSLERAESVADWIDLQMQETLPGFDTLICDVVNRGLNGRPFKYIPDPNSVQDRVYMLCALRESDRKNGTEALSSSAAAKLEAAFESLPRPVARITYSTHDLPFLMELKLHQDVRECGRKHQLSKTQVNAIIKLKKANPKEAAKIIEAGHVMVRDYKNADGKRVPIPLHKCKSTDICPKKPANPRAIDLGEGPPCCGLEIAQDAIGVLRDLSDVDQQFDEGLDEVGGYINKRRAYHDKLSEIQKIGKEEKQ